MPTAVTVKPTILKLSYLKFYPSNAGNCELRNSWQPTRGLKKCSLKKLNTVWTV